MRLSNRQRKIALKSIGTKPRGEVVQLRPKAPPRHYENDTGLAWLEHKGRNSSPSGISKAQRATGEWYGRIYRTSLIIDPTPVRSCLATAGMPRGGKGGADADDGIADTLAWIMECRVKVANARAIVGNHAGLILALDLICGRQLRPTEIVPDNQRAREEIVTSLRIALDMLEKVR